MLKIPAPRLLPATIAAMGALILLKSAVLFQSVVTHGAIAESGMVASANAASTDQTTEPAKDRPKPAASSEAQAEPARGTTPQTPSQAAPGLPIPRQAAPGQPEPGQAALVKLQPDGPPPVSDSEKALLQELRQRRQELDKRADAINGQESVLIATEQKLKGRVGELQDLQKKLEGLDAAKKQKEDAGWQGLVKMYEDMKPKEAATIFDDLGMPVLLQILDRMKEAKAAQIMAAMNPDKARDVTGQLAQMRTGHETAGMPVAGQKSSLSGG